MAKRGDFVGWLSTLAGNFITVVAALVLLESAFTSKLNASDPCSASFPQCDGFCSAGETCVQGADGAILQGSGANGECMCATLTPTATPTNTPTDTATATPTD